MREVPALKAPAGSCDCHVHIYDDRYPVVPTWAIPTPKASISDYLSVQRELGLERVVIVQANAYGFDNRCATEAIAVLGPHARGVAAVQPNVTDAELNRLNISGFRGARCFMLQGGRLSWPDVNAIAARVAPFGWHLQVQLDGRHLLRHETLLSGLPVNVVIDHNGKFLEPVPPEHPAFQALLRLLDTGRCWVKLAAPYETSKTGPPRYEDVSKLARALAQKNPERCLWASNWPHPGVIPAPSNAHMLDLLLDWAENESTRHRILVENPAEIYGY
jgi:D-galactarolactone isomerase